jgi:hypothetical protein
MTSDRRIASSRINGRRSRGPRTAAGKARGSRNALQHGLSVSVLNEPSMCTKVEMLARVIAGADADDAQLSQARIIAEAQIDLVRIRDAKVALMNSYIGEVIPSNTVLGENVVPQNLQEGEGASESDDLSSEGSCTQEFVMTPTIEVLRQLSRLERYECRAISRRRRGMRNFSCFNLLE